MNHGKRIAIVGAGPGGLILARILQLHGIRAVVFEREADASVRPQGGSLDMHPESGQYAIERAGLRAEFQRIARYDDQETRIYDKHANLLFIDAGVAGKNRPEVDRGHLRQMLLDSLVPETIRWGHELIAANPGEANPSEDGAFALTFRHGARECFDLIVGADGTWSRVRPLLSQARPVYAGVTFVELGIDDADVTNPKLAHLIGRGLTFAVGDSKALIGHRDANAHLGVYAALRVPEDWVARGGLDTGSSETLRASLAANFRGWSEDLLALIHRCGNSMTPRKLYALPVGHRWQHRPGVTLLGDAAHVMSPFGGDGANLAMQDAAGLALALIGDGDWTTAIERFEHAMFARAEEAAAGARDAMEEVFSEDGLAHILQQMKSHGGEGSH